MSYKFKTLSTLFSLTLFFLILHGMGYQHEIKYTLELDISNSNVNRVNQREYNPEQCRHNPSCNKLAEAIVYEARGESLFGQYAVGSVIINRAKDKSKRWPNTIYGVIHQGNGSQFEYIRNMHLQKTPTKEDWKTARMVAYDLLNEFVPLVTDANHYLNPRVLEHVPNWTRVYPKVASIGNHDFHKWN